MAIIGFRRRYSLSEAIKESGYNPFEKYGMGMARIIDYVAGALQESGWNTARTNTFISDAYTLISQGATDEKLFQFLSEYIAQALGNASGRCSCPVSRRYTSRTCSYNGS